MATVPVELVKDVWVPTDGGIDLPSFIGLLSQVIRDENAGYRPVAIGVRLVKRVGSARLGPASPSQPPQEGSHGG